MEAARGIDQRFEPGDGARKGLGSMRARQRAKIWAMPSRLPRSVTNNGASNADPNPTFHASGRAG